MRPISLTLVFEQFVDLNSLFKRRQIRNALACATATAYLLRRVVEAFKASDVATLIERVREVGRRLIAAQPRELAIGNIVRRVLGVIREEAEGDQERSDFSKTNINSHSYSPREKVVQPSYPDDPSPPRQIHLDWKSDEAEDFAGNVPPLASSVPYNPTISAPVATSMFNLLSHPSSGTALLTTTSGLQTSDAYRIHSHQIVKSLAVSRDLRAEVIEGIQEILDELSQADDQIAGYALDHIHSNEIVLTHSSSATVQKFLTKAATKRKFTVVQVEAHPNGHKATDASLIGRRKGESDKETSLEAFTKALTAVGITVISIPDSAVFALMSRVNKVILNPHAVLQNGSLVAAAGTKVIAKAAQMHCTHVVVLNAVYQVSPAYPFNPEALMENGDPSQVANHGGDNLVTRDETENPLFDYLPADLVDLYITNL